MARAQPEGGPPPVDAARQQEQYVIQPGAEPLFADMLGSGQTLRGECTLSDGQIDRTAVLATYTCGGGRVVLQLLHPEIAPPGGLRTRRFVLMVKAGAPPEGFVEAVAERIRARESAFEWARVSGRGGTEGMRWLVPVGAGAAVAVLVFLAMRRLAARYRRPG